MTPVPLSPAPPSATYRLQLQPAFPFAAAEAAVPYLAALGVSHLHLSPVLEAVPGSSHGYDVVDHARVRTELGGERGLRALAATARSYNLGLVLDIVPNHMAAVPRHNRALWEVLREGQSSPFARWFDIDWAAHGGRLLLPVLARPIGAELDALRVEGDVLRYHAHAFPLREGTAGLPLPALLDAQWYRLAWWRLARTELNYRRFFTISDLIGIRVEDPDIFDATHAKVLELLRDGVVDGLRVDHPDGLADPGGYLQRLHEATGGRWTVVEKILADGERLPASWPVAGTTGYDALRHTDGLFVDPAGVGELTFQYRDFTGRPADRGGAWEPTARRAAYRVITHELAAEVDRLARDAARCFDVGVGLGLGVGLASRDHAPWALRTALRELLVRIPVYRPYGTGDAARAVLTERAAREAKAAFAVADEARVVDDVRDLLLGGARGDGGDGPERRAFRARFGQTASALRAKAVEDTAFYRYVPLVSAAEVGGDPGRPAVSPGEFHAYGARVQRDWPTTGTVLSTHDAKRSAEVRAGIAVLTECPGRWAEFVAGVAAASTRGEGGQPPDPHLAWATWQTALGFARELRDTAVGETAVGVGDPPGVRLRHAMLKHAREAGLFTSWTEQDPRYEQALTAFVDAATHGPPLTALLGFAAELRPWVRVNVLGAALLHLTMPGVPDLYQGTEYARATLVDPDNRRPVRFDELGDIGDRDALDGLGDRDGRDGEKLALTRVALRLRRALPEAFGETATYRPLWARGPAADHCVAFTRSERVVTAVTRLPLLLADAGGWRDTELPLPAGRFVDLLTPQEEGERGREFSSHARARDLFATRPVALLGLGPAPRSLHR